MPSRFYVPRHLLQDLGLAGTGGSYLVEGVACDVFLEAEHCNQIPEDHFTEASDAALARAAIEADDPWGWGDVRVVLECDVVHVVLDGYSTTLGGCCYDGPVDFVKSEGTVTGPDGVARPSSYFRDLLAEASEDLGAKIRDLRQAVRPDAEQPNAADFGHTPS